MFTSLEAAKAGSKRLLSALETAGYPSKLNQCQAIIARVCGYRSWPDLNKTIDTAHAPAVESATAIKRFEHEILNVWPAGTSPDIPAMFGRVFQHGTRNNTGETLEFLRAKLQTLPSERIGQRSREDKPFHLFDSNDIRRRVVHLVFQERETLDIIIDSAIDSDSDEDLPVENVIAGLWRNNQQIGEISLSLLHPKRANETTIHAAADAGDHVSEEMFWTVLNYGRTAGKSAFAAGVAFLWHWELLPAERRQGLGTEFLRLVLADIRRDHRLLQTLAIDSGHPALDFSATPELIPLSVKHLKRYIETIDLKGALGSKGDIRQFDNSRQGGEAETMMGLGQVINGVLPTRLLGEDRAERIAAEGFERMSNKEKRFDNSAILHPKPLSTKEFPNGYSIFAVDYGELNPYPRIADHLPRELTNVLISFQAPDITFRNVGSGPILDCMVLTFANGQKLRLERHHLTAPLLDSVLIQDLNSGTPSCDCAPSWALGDLFATLSTNLRLLFSIKRIPGAPVPCLAEAEIDRSLGIARCGATVIPWPDEIEPKAFLATVQRHFEQRVKSRDLAIRSLARDILKDGSMERELYEDTWQGQKVIRHRFHQTPWNAPETITFSSIGSKLSPTTISEDCPAQEIYVARIHRVIAAEVKAAVEAALVENQPLLLYLTLTLVKNNHARNPVEAAAFLSELWHWWRDAVEDLYEHHKKTPLVELTGL